MRALPRFPFLLAGLLLVANAGAQSTQVYQWKDASGVTHYSDSPPPPGAKVQDRRLGNKTRAQEPLTQAPAESPQCTSAKLNLSILSSNKQVRRDTDGDGKPDTVMTEADHASQKALAEAAVKAYCKPAAAAS